jgi:hypothetical protein
VDRPFLNVRSFSTWEIIYSYRLTNGDMYRYS